MFQALTISSWTKITFLTLFLFAHVLVTVILSQIDWIGSWVKKEAVLFVYFGFFFLGGGINTKNCSEFRLWLQSSSRKQATLKLLQALNLREQPIPHPLPFSNGRWHKGHNDVLFNALSDVAVYSIFYVLKRFASGLQQLAGLCLLAARPPPAI